MNIKMWGPILAGGVIIAIGILLLVGYGFSFLDHPTAFAFNYAATDYLGMALNIVGLALVMIGGVFKK